MIKAKVSLRSRKADEARGPAPTEVSGRLNGYM